MRSDGLPLSTVQQKVASSTSQKQAVSAKCLANPPYRFHDNLYQIRFSGCSALPESRRQSLPHPYSPLRAPAFFRISRNRVQTNNPHLNKSFGMKIGEHPNRGNIQTEEHPNRGTSKSREHPNGGNAQTEGASKSREHPNLDVPWVSGLELFSVPTSSGAGYSGDC